MTTERIITTESTLNLADISTYTTESGNVLPTTLEGGVSITCLVTANGLDDDGGFVQFIEETNTVSITEPTPTIPEFVSPITIVLNPDGTGTATVTTAGEYDRIDWLVISA